jgi:periplasmic protein TonB
MRKFASILFLILLIIPINRIFSTGKDDLYQPFAEEMPSPIGGIEGIYKKITYPEMAKKAGVEGKVYLLLYINEEGNVDDVKVLKSLVGGCDEAAIEAIKNTKFTAGKNNGVPVKVKLTLQIVFKQTQ